MLLSFSHPSSACWLSTRFNPFSGLGRCASYPKFPFIWHSESWRVGLLIGSLVSWILWRAFVWRVGGAACLGWPAAGGRAGREWRAGTWLRPHLDLRNISRVDARINVKKTLFRLDPVYSNLVMQSRYATELIWQGRSRGLTSASRFSDAK